jgi:hypothetical protein
VGLRRSGVEGLALAGFWESADPLPGGRGTARLCSIAGTKAVIKKESRGGLSRYFLPNFFFLQGSFIRERSLAGYLKASGLAPAILDRQFVRTRFLFAVFTLVEYSEGACSIADLWRAGRLDPITLESAGVGVGRLHKAAVLHGDLNAGNILITPAGDALFLDLRHSRQCKEPLSKASRKRNFLRLARSLHKVRYTLGLEWPSEIWQRLAAGYAIGWGAREPWLDGWVPRCGKGFPLRPLLWRKASED